MPQHNRPESAGVAPRDWSAPGRALCYPPAMRRRITLVAPLLTLLVLSFACDKQGASQTPEEVGALGYDDASSPDLKVMQPALADEDLDGAGERGMILWKMQRAMRLGDRGFAGFVGVTSARFVALAGVDAAGGSGEVAFYRWQDADLEDGAADADEAKRWVVISVTFDPDQSMDPQEIDGKPSGEQRRTLAALAVAQAKAESEHADGRWVPYTFRELSSDGKIRQTRIYMMGSDERSPDLEFTVLDSLKAKKAPEITGQRLHLAAGVSAKLPLETPVSPPGPPTFARAVAIATATEKPVEVIDGNGSKYEVAPKTGAVTRK